MIYFNIKNAIIYILLCSVLICCQQTALITKNIKEQKTIPTVFSSNITHIDNSTKTPEPILKNIEDISTLEIIAGTGKAGLKDGPAFEAEFMSPSSMCEDINDGSIYIGDGANLRKLLKNGTVQTLSFGEPGFADGPIKSARFKYIASCVVINDGSVLIADQGNARIRILHPNNSVSSIEMPTVTYESYAAGKLEGLRTRQLEPNSLVMSKEGKIYIAANQYLLIFEKNLLKLITSKPSLYYNLTYKDGPIDDAQFGEPLHLAIDNENYLYVSDYILSAIREVSPTGRVVTFAGGNFACSTGNTTDGIGKSAYLGNISFLTYDFIRKVLYVVDNRKIVRKIDSDSVVQTIGILGQKVRGKKENWQTVFKSISGILVRQSGEVYFSDEGSYQIKKINFTKNPDLNPLNDQICD